MKRLLMGCLLLAGCESAELTAGGLQVRAIQAAPAGCRLVGTVREKEGGGLRSLEENRALVDTRLRNEAARIGGTELAVIEVVRGDSDEGQLHFVTGVAGLATPSARCTNCILVTAQVFQCEGQAPALGPDPLPAAPECAPAASRPALPTHQAD